MAEVLMIQGKVENIFNDRDFADMLREKLGSDAEDYFNRALDPDALYDAVYNRFRENPLEFCSGECDKIQRQQEYYENELRDIELVARELYKCYIAKKNVPHKEMDIVLRLIKKVVAAQ